MDHFTILVGLIGVLVIFPFCIQTSTSSQCKPNEAHHPPSCVGLCGDQLMNAFTKTCGFDRRKRASTDSTLNDIGLMKEEASNFLSIFRRSRVRTRRSSTTLVEECCGEQCITEEIQEYC
ncbi:hypothetical protein OS493_014161 [Desmophyllum pertusum]|uniref:Insulin-like domain-containing protein n=1 Tax=Desmophyllum pertusum TaxID=174260 RepID=A0A9X0CZZ5_9CNID|nr:hypothetical protein OS493_014161 [Desmophyllum pertusum]